MPAQKASNCLRFTDDNPDKGTETIKSISLAANVCTIRLQMITTTRGRKHKSVGVVHGSNSDEKFTDDNPDKGTETTGKISFSRKNNIVYR